MRDGGRLHSVAGVEEPVPCMASMLGWYETVCHALVSGHRRFTLLAPRRTGTHLNEKGQSSHCCP